MKIFNQRKQNLARQELRNQATAFEKILWSRLRKRQCGGFRFVRQFGVGPYIVDFYCPQKRLAIELDGSQHATHENQVYDEERTQYLHQLGICVLRFWNSEINSNLEGVLDEILQRLESEHPFDSPLSLRGEEAES